MNCINITHSPLLKNNRPRRAIDTWRTIAPFIIIATCFVLPACSVNPVTGERRLSLVSEADEIQMGKRYYIPSQQQQGGQYRVDPKLTPYIAEIGQNLAAVSERPHLPFEFVVLNSSVPNAWAMPGGKVAINRGLLVLLEDEAQLAAVMGHEVVHAVAGHGAEQMSQQKVLGIGTAIAGIAAAKSDSAYGQYIGLGLAGAAKGYQAYYGREQELESDKYGIKYMVDLGYHPYAAVELQETFVKLSRGQKADFFSALFASHPPSQQRVDRNKSIVAALPPQQQTGKRNKVRYKKAIAQLLKDAAAYKKHEQAMAAISKKDANGALRLINQAISIQPRDALFYNSKGQFQLQKQDFKAAESAFKKAFQFNPYFFQSALGLGLAQKAQNKHASAKTYLEKSLRILPTQVAIFHLGEIAQKSNNPSEAARYYKQAAASGGDLGKAATERLTKMGIAITP